MTERRKGQGRRDIETRQAPNNLEAERAVLGAILIDNKSFDAVAGSLCAAHFFRDAHRRIYTCIADLIQRGKEADLVTLKEELATRKDRADGVDWLEECGGPAYVASVVDGVPRSTNIRYYADVVRDKWSHRQLIQVGQWMIDAGYSQELGPRQIVSEADLRLTTLATAAKLAMGAVALGSSLSSLNHDLAQRVERRGQIAGFPTGFPKLDLFTHGWQRRKMVVIAGQTSFGKSILALNAALSIALAGGRVVYYSYEMPAQDLQYRLLSQLSGVALSQILWGNIRTDAEWAAIRQAQAVMESLPIEINDSSSRSVADARAECRQIKADRGLAACVLDHFQLTEDAEGENRTQQLASTSRRIQSLGVELDITTFTLSQLTVDPKDAAREPQLEDLRECKSLGHDADLVAMLHPYKASDVRNPDVSVVPFKLLIRKNRGERLGLVSMNLERDYVRFVESDPPVVVKPEPKKVTTGRRVYDTNSGGDDGE